MMSKYPSAIMEATRESDAAGPSGSSNMPSLDPMPINRQLKNMGFRPAHVDSCCRALVAAHDRLHRPSTASSSSRPTQDPLMLSLSLLAPLEAAIEWLLVHLPEDDLPAAYRSSASVDFVSSVKGGQGGQAELRKTWVADKLARKAGFPRKVVEAVVTDAVQDDGIVKESMVIDLLGRRLCGWEDDEEGWGTEEYGNGWDGDETQSAERRTSREEELIILESVLDERIQKVGDDELAIEITDVPGQDLVLNIVFSDHSSYPSPRYPTHPPAFYLTSRSLPAYLRLHLHAEVLRAFRDPERPDLRGMLEAGAGGAVYAMMETLEAALPACLENPPDIASVTQYLVPKIEDAPEEVQVRKRMQKLKMRGGRGRQSGMTEAEVKAHHEAMQNAPGWQSMLEARQRLPAWSSRQHIIDALEKNRVVVIVGETGSGKSTQSPSYILDHEISQGRGASTNIIVTQPRRVAAIGVATRVAEERMEDLDKAAQTVGYVIRGESRTNAKMSKITFCTTGVVLRRLASGGDADLEGVSHVIVDEVHERSVDGDFLLLQLREVLKRNKKIKVGYCDRQTSVPKDADVPATGHLDECHHQPGTIHQLFWRRSCHRDPWVHASCRRFVSSRRRRLSNIEPQLSMQCAATWKTTCPSCNTARKRRDSRSSRPRIKRRPSRRGWTA
jgi:ATP-dependent RNA helicase DHX57